MAMKKDMNVLAVGLDRATNTLEPFAVNATGELTASSNIDSIAVPTNSPRTGQAVIAVTGTFELAFKRAVDSAAKICAKY